MAGVDFNVIKQRIIEEQQKALAKSAGFSGTKFFRTTKQQHRIRLMPPWSEKGDFALDGYMHYGVGLDEDNAQSFMCPQNTKSIIYPNFDCPICVYCERLRASDAPADQEFAYRMRAQIRYYSNVVDLDDPIYTDTDVQEWIAKQQDKSKDCPFAVGDTKVQIYSYSKTIYNEILNLFGQTNVDITSYQSGHSLTLTKKQGNKEKRFTQYGITPELQSTPFIWRGSNKELPNLDKELSFRTPDKMAKAISALTGGETTQVLPAAPPPPQLPPAVQPAVVTQATVHQMRPMPAPQVQVKSIPAVAVPQVQTPACYKDLKTWSPQDVECAGGINSDTKEQFDTCPFYSDCEGAKTAAMKPQTPSRRRGVVTPVLAPPVSTGHQEVDALEAELRQALKD